MRVAPAMMDNERRSIPVQVGALVIVIALAGTAVWYAWRSRPEVPPSGEQVKGRGEGASSWRGNSGVRESGEGFEPAVAQDTAAASAEIHGLVSDVTGGEGTAGIEPRPEVGSIPGATASSGDVRIAWATGAATGPGSVPDALGTPPFTPAPTATPGVSPQGTTAPEVAATPTRSNHGNLGGRVAGRITGNPVPGMNVLCSFGGTAVGTVVSDSRGGFLFEDLVAGMYRVETVGQRSSADVEVVGGETTDVLLSVDDQGSISGRVVDTRGWPVRGATVRLLRSREGPFGEGEEAVTRAGDDGAFFLLGAPVGVPVKLRAEHHGYAPATRGDFVIQGDSPLEGVELVLTPGGIIAGRVTDRQGSPIAPAHLEARVRGQWGRVNLSQQGGTATTGSDGSYQIPNLPPGEWDVQATANGYALQRKGCSVPLGNQTVTLDFALMPGDMLTGLVVESGGMPVSGAAVRLLGGLVSKHTQSDAEGTFEFESVPEGSYNIAAERAGYSPAWRAVNTQDSRQLTLTLEDLATLSVRVVTGEDQPVESYTLRIARKGFPHGLLAESEETQVRVSSPNGVYATDVSAGSYRLTITAQGYQNGQKEVTLEPGSAGPPILIGLRGGMVLPGQVVSVPNGAPVEGAYISWFPGHIPVGGEEFYIPNPGLLTDPMGTVVSEAGGYFLLDGLPPTRITVLCRAAGFAPWLSRGLFMGDPPAELLITVEPGVRVTGSVYYLDLPFPYASVELQPEEAVREVPTDWRTGTDGRGEFLIDLVSPGPYRLLVTREYHGSLLWRGFRVGVPFEDTRFDLVLPSGEISVTLIDAVSGIRPADATVKLQYVQIQQESGDIRLEIPPRLTLKYPDGNGAFTFVALPAGEYLVEASAQGYETVERPVVLSAGGHLTEQVLISPSVVQ